LALQEIGVMAFSLTDLETIVADRASVEDGSSYTASLLARGPAKCAQKFGEEAVETVIAALSADRRELAKEAADALYHLLVLLRACDVPLTSVMAELERRTARSGLEEKAARDPSAP
jgi:phosphoribosyl-ATP pyrophosphohydrolase